MPLSLGPLVLALACVAALVQSPSVAGTAGPTPTPSLRTDARIGTGTLDLRPAIAQPGRRWSVCPRRAAPVPWRRW